MDKPSRRLTSLEDPRGSNTVHRLGDIILIAVASALCGGATCVAYAQFAYSKKAFLEKLLGPFTPPSHDTFSRLFRLLDPEAFGRCFAQFAAAFADSLDGVVAIDGKALRRAHETGLATSPPLMVTAWAANARLALAGVMPDPAKGAVRRIRTSLRFSQTSRSQAARSSRHSRRAASRNDLNLALLSIFL